jgi:hypothetical protein
LWERFHRRIVIAIAALTVVVSAFTVTAPAVVGALVPDAPLLPRFVGIVVPPRAQPILVVLIGLICLVEGIFLFYLHPIGWWLALVTSVAGILHAFLSLRGSFLPILVSLVLLVYLIHIRRIFVRI